MIRDKTTLQHERSTRVLRVGGGGQSRSFCPKQARIIPQQARKLKKQKMHGEECIYRSCKTKDTIEWNQD
jgi:hypothetical protein